jgi:hypothetical protein
MGCACGSSKVDIQVKHALGWSEYQVRSDKAIRRHWQLVCCAFSFCWYHASHSCATPTQEPPQASERQDPPQLHSPAEAVGTGKKNQRGNQATAPHLLAHGSASRTRMARTLDHAAALLASVVRTAPTPCRAAAPGLA